MVEDEFAGEIVAMGRNVEGLRIGQRVSGEGHLIGKTSRQSRAGRFHHVSSIAAAGLYQGVFREDMFEEGQEVIKLGHHRFSVNTQPLDLTMVPRDGEMHLHLSGTDFYERVDDPDFAATSEYWQQELVSETPTVYRGEYLAACILAPGDEAIAEKWSGFRESQRS